MSPKIAISIGLNSQDFTAIFYFIYVSLVFFEKNYSHTIKFTSFLISHLLKIATSFLSFIGIALILKLKKKTNNKEWRDAV